MLVFRSEYRSMAQQNGGDIEQPFKDACNIEAISKDNVIVNSQS